VLDWRNSRPHLLLLTKFLRSASPTYYATDERWKAVLSEEPEGAIRRFAKEGLLLPPSLAELIDFKFKASELKDLLRARHLKVSGRKEELLDRLIQADSRGMERATNGTELLKCSPEAAQVVEDYLLREKEFRKAVESEVLALLERGEYAKASQAVSVFEATQVFPRGLGIDWASRGHDEDVDTLRVIFERTPQILRSVEPSLLGKLRLAAGASFLWGTNTATAWLPDTFATGIHLEADTAARMLVFHASHVREMEQYREVGVTEIEIIPVSDDRTCAPCHAIQGRSFRLAATPEFPYSTCTSEMGCRCEAVAKDFG
jgi:hypothetical protein